MLRIMYELNFVCLRFAVLKEYCVLFIGAKKQHALSMHRTLQAQQQEAQDAERKGHEALKSSLLAALETVNESLPLSPSLFSTSSLSCARVLC